MWNAFIVHEQLAAPGYAIYGSTQIDKRIGYLRGTILVEGHPLNKGETYVSAEHLIAHELAHIYLHSKDERKVEIQAVKWMNQQKKYPGSLVAPVLIATHASGN